MNTDHTNDDFRAVDSDECGATAVEYGLLAALIAGVIITTVTLLGTATQGAFNSVIGLF